MPLILPGNVASATADVTYSVANSCRFNKGDSPSLVKDQSASPTHDDKGTLSFWFKIGNLSTGDGHYFFSVFTDSNNRMQMLLQSDNTLKLIQKTGGSTVISLITNRVFRDVSAWYHLVLACDSSQGVAANRIKIYINGVQETSFSTETYPAQDLDIQLVKGTEVCLGAYNKASPSDHFDGYLAEMVLIDGTQNAVTDFGEFDEDSPTIWKPINVSGLTFGTNGFYLDFEDSANLGNDANGGTDLTETNLAAADQATDTPTNNFCTFMSHTTSSLTTLAEGNLMTTGNSASNNGNALASFGITNGKWYFELELDNAIDDGYPVFGMVATTDAEFGHQSLNGGTGDPTGRIYGINADGGMYNGSSGTDDWTSAFSDGNVLGFAFDMDNGAWYLHLNGTYYESGDPTSGASKTGATVTWTADGRTLVPFASNYNGSIIKFNFGGCPAFAISSGNADGNGYGNFEYAVPSGFLAMCTKNLGSDG